MTARLCILLSVSALLYSGTSIAFDNFDGSTLGTPFGNPGYIPGAPGLNQAIQLNSGQFVQYSVPASLESAGTIEVWIKPGAYVGLLTFNWYNTTTAPSSGYVLNLGLTPSGDVAMGGWATDPANMYTLQSTTAVPLDQWSAIAISWSSAGAKVYVDGVLSNTSNQPWQPAAPQWAYLNNWGAFGFGGVDRLIISDVQKTDAQILADAQATPEPLSLGLVAAGLALILARKYSQ